MILLENFENLDNISNPRVQTKMEPDPDSFTYQDLNKDLNPIINMLEFSGESRTHLHFQLWLRVLGANQNFNIGFGG